MSDERIISVRKDRRGGPGVISAQQEKAWAERRTHCWDIQGCDAKTRDDCYAYFVGQNCWDIWALRPPERRYCCQRRADCRTCPVTLAKFGSRTLPIHVPVKVTTLPRPRSVPQYQPASCRYFFIEGLSAVPTDPKVIRMMVRSLSRDERDVFRCRLRRVHLEWSYVADLCASRHHPQCVFLEEK